MSAESSCMRRTADNSGHTATLRSAQIRKRTSYLRRTLSEIAGDMLNKKGGEIKCIAATKIR